MSTISESFAANELKAFTKPGAFFKLFTTSYSVDVRFYKNGQELRYDALGVEAGFGVVVPEVFDTVTIQNGATAQTVKWFQTTSGQVSYDRTVGSVQVTWADPNLNLYGDAITAAGQAFIGNAVSIANPGLYSHAQIKNPSGSLIVCYVDRVYLQGAAAGDAIIASAYNTDELTLSGQFLNKNLGSAASITQLRKDNTGAATHGTIFGQLPIAGTGGFVEFKPPIRLEAGEGVTFRSSASNQTINFSAEIREKSS